MPHIITLTTDFGLSDPFVGIMKGIILGFSQDVQFVDLTHLIPPQDILAGALALEAALPHFPSGTIHLAVVDPGVGSERQALAIQTERSIYIAPDNGLVSLALQRERVIRKVRLPVPMTDSPGSGHTFHGRDVFARAVGLLASGARLETLGEPTDSLVTMPIPEPEPEDGGLRLRALCHDHFGNLVTNARMEDLYRLSSDLRSLGLYVGSSSLQGIRRTYSDVEPHEPVAYIGSGGPAGDRREERKRVREVWSGCTYTSSAAEFVRSSRIRSIRACPDL